MAHERFQVLRRTLCSDDPNCSAGGMQTLLPIILPIAGILLIAIAVSIYIARRKRRPHLPINQFIPIIVSRSSTQRTLAPSVEIDGAERGELKSYETPRELASTISVQRKSPLQPAMFASESGCETQSTDSEQTILPEEVKAHR